MSRRSRKNQPHAYEEEDYSKEDSRLPEVGAGDVLMGCHSGKKEYKEAADQYQKNAAYLPENPFEHINI